MEAAYLEKTSDGKSTNTGGIVLNNHIMRELRTERSLGERLSGRDIKKKMKSRRGIGTSEEDFGSRLRRKWSGVNTQWETIGEEMVGGCARKENGISERCRCSEGGGKFGGKEKYRGSLESR